MKNLLLFLSLFSIAGVYGQVRVGNIRIGNDTFIVKTTLETTDYTDEPISKISIYKMNSKLLTHTKRKIGGDHNSTDLELGTYDLSDSTITFYSYWARAGDAPVSPFGARKQVYKVNKNGRLTLFQSELYIETSRQGWEENKGIKYLFQSPRNRVQQKLLLQYIKGVEKEYNAHFVFGAKSDSLLREVRAKMGKEIYAETKDWNTIEAYKTFGYKK